MSKVNRAIVCRWCGQAGYAVTPRSVYCSAPCQNEARKAQAREHTRRRYHGDPEYRHKLQVAAQIRKGLDPEAAGTRGPALSPSDRTCPTCRIRHRIPRVLPQSDTSLPVLTISKYDYQALYRYAALFIEAGGGEDVDPGEACEACGRWSVIAYLDWLKAELADVA